MARLWIAFGSILFLIGCTKNNVSSKLQINGFNPMSGPVDTTVVIGGYHFSSDITQDIVTFNGVRAKVKSATDNQLVVTVPPLATTGNIQVSVDTGMAISAEAFTVATNRWSFLTYYPGTKMGSMASFQIGDNIYMGIGGINGGNSGEFWQYNIPTDQWTPKAEFPKVVPGQTFGFAVGGKGYVIVDMETPANPPLYEYDPASDAWTLVGEFPQVDFDATMTTFTIGNYAYAGLTNNGNYSDYTKMFRFDPTTNWWTPIANYPGTGYEFTASFVIGNYAYVGTGTMGLLFEGGAADYHKDFYQYDPSSDVWTRKADFAGEARCFAVGFSIGNYGYIGSGNGHFAANLTDFWRYDPSSDSWSQIASYGDRNQMTAISFSGNQFGYAGFANGNPDPNMNDQQPQLWIYHPQE